MSNPNNVAHGTLTANNVSTVTLNNSGPFEVVNRTGTAEIYFTFGLLGVTPTPPTIGGSDCYPVPSGLMGYVVDSPGGNDGPLVVSLISSGTPSFSVIVGTYPE